MSKPKSERHLAADDEPLVAEDGTILTDEVIARLAEEAERGYDLSQSIEVRVGRPSLGGSGTSPRLNVRVSPETFEAARRKADDEGVTLSEVAREAIRRYVGA